MKTFLLCLSGCLCSLICLAQGSKSNSGCINVLDPGEAHSITIDFPCTNIWPEKGDASVFVIEMSISANMPHKVLEALIKVGRYDLQGVKKGDEFFITAPNLSNSITIQGIELKEKINLYVQTPGTYTLHEKTLSRDLSTFTYRGVGTALVNPMANMKKIKEKIEIKTIKTKCEGLECEEIVLKQGDILVNGEVLVWE